jgi:hypothetical protein
MAEEQAVTGERGRWSARAKREAVLRRYGVQRVSAAWELPRST